MKARSIILAVMALVACAGVALAQQQTGNLFGTVADETGQPLPGVTLTLGCAGAPQVQVSDGAGQFRFLSLGPGACTLTAELEGFEPASYPNLGIIIGRDTWIDVMLVTAAAAPAPAEPPAGSMGGGSMGSPGSGGSMGSPGSMGSGG